MTYEVDTAAVMPAMRVKEFKTIDPVGFVAIFLFTAELVGVDRLGCGSHEVEKLEIVVVVLDAVVHAEGVEDFESVGGEHDGASYVEGLRPRLVDS